MKRIVTLTMNPSIDKSSSVDRVVPERKLRCKPPTYEPGGGGINVSKAMQRLGGISFALIAAGGPTGSLLEEMLTQMGLNFHILPMKGRIRENFTVFEEATKLQYRFNMPGPAMHKQEWEQCLKELSTLRPKPAYIVASGTLPQNVPIDFYARVAKIAKKLGSRIIVDASKEPLRSAVQEGIYLIKPNLDELAEIAGQEVKHDPEIKEAARQLIGKGHAEIVVVSLGAAGALLISAKTAEHIPAPTVPIRSKVGAGDSMVAGVVMSLAQGKPLRDAVRFGVAAGSAAVMSPGTELCRREDAERLYRQMMSTKK